MTKAKFDKFKENTEQVLRERISRMGPGTNLTEETSVHLATVVLRLEVQRVLARPENRDVNFTGAQITELFGLAETAARNSVRR